MDGRISSILQRQVKGYSKDDPSVNRQQCLPVEIFERLVSRQTNDKFLEAYHTNITLGFFFAMRACECLCVDGNQRLTVCINKQGIMLFRKGLFIAHDDPNIDKCDQVAILFEQ
jgi:hypothetical protein